MLDQGDIAGCRAILMENSAWLTDNATSLECPSLKELAEINLDQSKKLEGVTENRGAAASSTRKAMRAFSTTLISNRNVLNETSHRFKEARRFWAAEIPTSLLRLSAVFLNLWGTPIDSLISHRFKEAHRFRGLQKSRLGFCDYLRSF